MLPTSQTENQEVVPEAEIPDNPPADIQNIDVPVRDAVQDDDQLEAVPIENEPVAVRSNNVQWS